MTHAALIFALDAAGKAIQLTPAGPAFRANDGSGHPEDVAAWWIDREIAQRLIARMKAKKNPLSIDYKHQTR